MTTTHQQRMDASCRIAVADRLIKQPHLPIARYRFSAQMVDALALPPYAGSLLRGQFGAALRDLACMTRQSTCTACPLRSTCPYPRIFEAPAPPAHQLQRFSAIPNAYVIEPPCGGFDATPQHHPRVLQPGQTLQFHMVLVGKVLEQLPLVVVAWQRALAQGLSKSRSRATLTAVDWLDVDGLAHPVWSEHHPQIEHHTPSLHLRTAPPSLEQLRLQIHTPLRLQKQGRPLQPEQLSARALISAVARRVALVMEFHAGQADWGSHVPTAVALAQQLNDQRNLHWFDWKRYSSRQQQEMTLGGVIGQWDLQGPTDALAGVWPWLWLGQWLHAGKETTFGLGHYTLVANAADSWQH